ncbi:apoptosis facilitator Bcl-2-like protein 14 [Corythoichthys intestinalis]|uniref:apoptosis facilitator Bcl-2-like protein 14 n=1 Tax=Corythoichthys intestinalis TaxID=161448 RepID=UPI0025A5E266|nr:apoptosis facilitator Bcl-2-like protein 14 [Corythoichthys intestinalis]XP_061809216.1 apoptosis facilitator Bcl-2-like protein 14 [Nerophis lumbriciformis]
MANGRIEIHDPFANQNDLGAPTSGEDGLQNTQEFRLLMAYTKRRRCQINTHRLLVEQLPSDSPAKSNEETPTKTKKRKKWKRLPRILMCIKPETDKRSKMPEMDIVERGFRRESPVDLDKEEETEDVDEVAIKLTEIVDDIPFAPPELETDSPDDEDTNMEKLVGLLLREHGDRFDEQVTRDLKETLSSTRDSWNYSFYERLMKTMLKRMGLFNADPEGPGPQTSPKTQMAVACEVTSRLSAVDTLPANRLLGYGATYLHNHFSSWAEQQGGYEAAFDDEDDDDHDVQ